MLQSIMGRPYDAGAAQTPLSRQIRVALVEDDADFRKAIVAAQRQAGDILITGIAVTRAEGLRLLEGAAADVLLVGLGLPDGPGIDVIRSAGRLWPGCGMMVCTAFGEQSPIIQCIEAGAVGYLLKDSEPHAMLEEIRSIGNGGGLISPLIARWILTRFRSADHSLLPMQAFQILELITRGFTADEAARRMQMSQHAVLVLIRHVYSRLEGIPVVA